MESHRKSHRAPPAWPARKPRGVHPFTAPLWFLALGVLAPGACRKANTTDAPRTAPAQAKGQTAAGRTLTLGAYTTPREPYGKAILPAFQKQWRAEHGEDLTFEESYLGSGAQARAIVGGFEADIAALSLEADIQKIAQAGLITQDWKATPTHGMITRSIVVIGVRPGNPKGIKDWPDLARPGLQVLTPNVRTSGGAMWNILAIWGAARRGKAGVAAGDPDAAVGLLGGILRNVPIMDKGARESMLTFENGIGDAIITYENEILVAQKAGQRYDYVVPPSTILIENPVAIVDGYAERHRNTDLARAFVAYLITPPAQQAFADFGYRPVDPEVAKALAARFPPVADCFTVADLGGWAAVDQAVFRAQGIYDQAMARANQGR